MVKALAIALAAALAALAWQSYSLKDAELTISQMREAGNAAVAKAEADARAAEQSSLKAIFNGASMYDKGKTDAQATADRTVADLRNGNLRLRSEWAGCETNRLSEGSAAAIELGEAIRRRNESTSRILRAVDECDAQNAGLIAAYNGVAAAINRGN